MKRSIYPTPPIESDPEKLLTYPEVASYLNLSQRYIRLLVKKGDLSCIRVGAAVRFRKQTLRDFIAKYEGCKGLSGHL